MHDGVESRQVAGRHVADVQLERGHGLGAVAEVAAAIVESVEPDDVMARLAQDRAEHGADVAVMAGDEELIGASSRDEASRLRGPPQRRERPGRAGRAFGDVEQRRSAVRAR